MSLRDGFSLVSLRDGLILKAAGAPQAPFFLLLAQKKEGKEKGTLLTPPSASLRFSPVAARKELASCAGSNTFSLHP